MSSDNAKRWELIKQAEVNANFHKLALGLNPLTAEHMGYGAAFGAAGGLGKNLVQNFSKEPDDEDRSNLLVDVGGGAALGAGLGGLYNQTLGAPDVPELPPITIPHETDTSRPEPTGTVDPEVGEGSGSINE